MKVFVIFLPHKPILSSVKLQEQKQKCFQMSFLKNSTELNFTKCVKEDWLKTSGHVIDMNTYK